MFVLVMIALLLLGGVTWLVLDRPVTRDAARNDRLTVTGLVAALVAGVVTVVAAGVTAGP